MVDSKNINNISIIPKSKLYIALRLERNTNQ